MSAPTFAQPPGRRPRGGGRTASLVASVLAGVLALVLLATGGALLWGDAQKDDAGFHSTSSHPFAANSHALVSDDLDLDGVGVIGSGDAGRVRLEVDTAKPDEPVFVGIARTAEVATYLRDVAHTTVTDVDFSPFAADYRAEVGPLRPAPPAREDFWSASAHGDGTQTLDWTVDDGNWSVVVMNADGSEGVRAQIRAGAELPHLATVAWGVMGGGLLLLLTATSLLVAGLRPPRRPRPAPASGFDLDEERRLIRPV